MELNHSDGKLEVQYDESLVKLIREVRQFQGLGYSVPAKIKTTAANAMKFYKQAIILKQVSIDKVFNFYLFNSSNLILKFI